MRSTRLQRQIDDLVAQGWQIEDEDRDRVVMVNREFGSVGSHILVAVLTVWFSMGLGNVLWGAYNYASNSQRRVLWEGTTDCPSCGSDVSADAAYCPACGDDLEDLESQGRSDAVDENGIACPSCEAVITEGSRYCPACGTKIADVIGDANESQ